MPLTLAAAVHSESLIRKSRFIGCVQPARDRPDAMRIVAGLWAEHPLASHVCWALLAGGHSAAVDDGEPGGTAGRPMLEVLRHQQLDGVLATVVRYYGGINLGAGGLARAYAGSVAQALLHAEKIAIVHPVAMGCSAPYALEGLIRRELERAGADLQKVSHAERVEFDFSLPETQTRQLLKSLEEAAAGRIQWRTGS
ncbi:YigZ family protein [Candidatus Woesearchaeota archaeon]|nr:YigZ family protein [Candidatus Woesearchaeota archaeon]